MKKFVTLEFLVGLLTILMSILTMYPFKFFGMRTGGTIFVFGIAFSGLTLLLVGIFRLASVFPYEALSLDKKISVVTSVLVMATAITILYFQIVLTENIWLHFLFGIGLLSYSVGLVAVGTFSREFNLGLSTFNLAMSVAVGILSIIVILFPSVLISSVPSSQVYISYVYFARIALVLIGVDCLVSATLTSSFVRQKTEDLEIKSDELA